MADFFNIILIRQKKVKAAQNLSTIFGWSDFALPGAAKGAELAQLTNQPVGGAAQRSAAQRSAEPWWRRQK
jgi:hypothetical protein